MVPPIGVLINPINCEHFSLSLVNSTPPRPGVRDVKIKFISEFCLSGHHNDMHVKYLFSPPFAMYNVDQI